jgi:hypothetical protein
MGRRIRVKHTSRFEDRLAAEALRLKEQAEEMPQGLDRELLLRRAMQCETASYMSEWLTSPSPK